MSETTSTLIGHKTTLYELRYDKRPFVSRQHVQRQDFMLTCLVIFTYSYISEQSMCIIESHQL